LDIDTPSDIANFAATRWHEEAATTSTECRGSRHATAAVWGPRHFGDERSPDGMATRALAPANPTPGPFTCPSAGEPMQRLRRPRAQARAQR